MKFRGEVYHCIKCGTVIPQGRVEFFHSSGRRVKYCVKCSVEEPAVSFMVYDHKTAGYAVVLPQNEDGITDKETVRLAKRAYERKR